MERPEPPLVVIVGPTASGKTALAIRLAKRYDGEVICADSRTVYRDMDIGTAKPTPEEQADVPHWGLDMVDPGQRFTAADFKQYALRKVAEIKARGRIPFIVGGAGLYIDGVLFDYEFGEGYDPTRRSQLEALTIEKLYDYCHDNNITLPGNDRNKRYIIRAIEQESINKKRKHRSEQMLANGVVDEAIILGKKYGWKNEAMTGNVYPLVKSYLEGQITYDDIKDKNTTLDWQLAKRQMTWFRRNPYIYWGDGEQIYRYVASVLEHKV